MGIYAWGNFGSGRATRTLRLTVRYEYPSTGMAPRGVIFGLSALTGIRSPPYFGAHASLFDWWYGLQ